MGRPGRPRKTDELQVTHYDPTENYAVVKGVDIKRIRQIVNEAIKYGEAPTDPNDFLGAQYSVRFGVLLSNMKQIAEELGI